MRKGCEEIYVSLKRVSFFSQSESNFQTNSNLMTLREGIIVASNKINF